VRRTGGERHWCPFWVRLSGCGRRVAVIKPNEDATVITKIEGGRCSWILIYRTDDESRRKGVKRVQSRRDETGLVNLV
jgi:hypothetical protein